MTPAERILWNAVRGRRFVGFKFRRQQVFGGYILDFFCSHIKLVLEIDGESHLANEEYDKKRSQWLESQGIKVLRFWNNQIFDDLDSVLEMIFRECDARRLVDDNKAQPTEAPPPHPRPHSPGGERGEIHP
jgi:very-short-patch-repair endonuclease